MSKPGSGGCSTFHFFNGIVKLKVFKNKTINNEKTFVTLFVCHTHSHYIFPCAVTPFLLQLSFKAFFSNPSLIQINFTPSLRAMWACRQKPGFVMQNPQGCLLNFLTLGRGCKSTRIHPWGRHKRKQKAFCAVMQGSRKVLHFCISG